MARIELVHAYDPLLFVGSVAIAAFAGYVALWLIGRVQATEYVRHTFRWLVAASAAMGVGIWSMHFTGMLALRLPVQVGYEPGLTLLSMVIAVFVSLLALLVIKQEDVPTPHLVGASVLMGAAISGMHYTGMAAMRLPGEMLYRPGLVLASIAVAVIASSGALGLFLRYRGTELETVHRVKVLGGLGLGAAVSGMHYTGMAAARFRGLRPGGEGPAGGLLLGDTLALGVGIGTLVLLALGLAAALLDRRLEAAYATELRERDRRFQQMAETIEEVFWLRDPTHQQMLYISPAFEQVMGRPVEELYEDPRLWLEIVHPEDRQRVAETVVEQQATEFELEYRVVRPDGEVRWIRDRGFPVRDDDGTVNRVAGVALDITEARRASRESERQRRMLSRILDTAADGILLTDADGEFEFANPAAEEILGLEADEISARSYRDPRWEICGPEGGPFPEEHLPVAQVLRTGLPVTGVEHGMVRPDGSRIILSVHAKPLTDLDGRVTGVVASIRDVTERKQYESELQHRALHDHLTGLPNRALFRDRLDHALERAERVDEGLAILFIDLKRFKVINDSLGHDAGDHVLKEVARRLGGAVRNEDTVARWGGDEFTVLLEHVGSETSAVEAAERLVECFEAPVRLEDREVPIEASIGIATLGGGREVRMESSELIHWADRAMYEAKKRPGTVYATAEPEATSARGGEVEREARLRAALEEGRIRTVYQPVYSLVSGRIRGVEALARWREPDLGEVSPGTFIPLAEETGLILTLGRQQLERACRQLLEEDFADRWGDRPLRLSVNFSARQLEHPGIVQETQEILETTGFPPSRLCLEITESAAMRKPEVVEQMKRIGVELAIDDFGTRYSTLSQLRRLPVDTLKIDRTFVDGLPDDEKDRAIVETILTLGRTLKLAVVAEGVENEQQLEALRSLGCKEAQGFYLGGPQPAEELRALLEESARAV